ncbi:hypothetical protein J6590_017042 [Homalodisca vitripennis]|nr:hypothetical protein J6590_017042 [Homalodisca vitripennis]
MPPFHGAEMLRNHRPQRQALLSALTVFRRANCPLFKVVTHGKLGEGQSVAPELQNFNKASDGPFASAVVLRRAACSTSLTHN